MPARSLQDLPSELWLSIFSYLDVRSFYNFISTKRAIYETYLNEPTYWMRLVHIEYRVAKLLATKDDGIRWRTMYKRFKLDSRPYAWGSNTYNCLNEIPDADRNGLPHSCFHYPRMMPIDPEMGSISDMQCGGWSTSLLASDGRLYISGVIDSFTNNISSQYRSSLKALQYPRKHGDLAKKYNPSIAIRQYSHGHSHILALGDDGSIWSWQNANHIALRVKFLHHDIVDRSGKSLVEKVVAGFNKSAALILGTGIVVLNPVGRDEDAVLVLTSALVPSTVSLERSSLQHHGKVLNFVLLEEMLAFVSSHGKVFISMMECGSANAIKITTPIEIKLDHITHVDVQGAYRTFAMLTNKDEVLILTQQKVIQTITSTPDVSKLSWSENVVKILALQKTNVIAMAFGDSHFHALHAQGHITSYGQNDYSSALGICIGRKIQARRIRGFTRNDYKRLLPHAYTRGRRVWFEEVKRKWLMFLVKGGHDVAESQQRVQMCIGGGAHIQAQAEVSDWIEQESQDWETKYSVPGWTENELPAYFAWTVAAGGWHSGALVLVDHTLEAALEKAVELPVDERDGRGQSDEKSYIWEKDSFPRLKLADGTEMPGQVPFDQWRYGRPHWDLDSVASLID